MRVSRYAIPAAAVALALLGASARSRNVVFETESAYHRIMVKEPGDGFRYLLFDRARGEQSAMKLDDPYFLKYSYTRTAFVGFAFQPNPQRVLLVGLGGASIPKLIRKHYPDVEIDIVEIDPAVVEVAKKYFAFRPDDKMKVFVSDGRAFIRRTQGRYDIILLDAYNDNYIPFHLTTLEFLKLVRDRLNPGGVVVSNIWTPALNKYFHAEVKTFQAAFSELYLFEAVGSGNYLFVAQAEAGRRTKGDLVAQAVALDRDKKFHFDLAQRVRDQYEYATHRKAEGKVLTDDYAPVNLLRSRTP